MASLRVLVLFICVNSIFGYSLMDDSEMPIWPPEYHIKAEKINLDNAIVENMEIWTSSAVNRSRIDFYSGLVKKYYHWKTDFEDTCLYSLVPKSTEEYQNKITCTRHDVEDKDIESALPTADDFQLEGNEQFEGKTVKVWKYGRVFEQERWMERTLYTYESEDYDIPVRFEAKNYLIKNGALTAHTIVSYYDFQSTVDVLDLDVGVTDDCEYMGLLGEDFSKDINHLHPAKETDVKVAFRSYKKHHSKRYGSESEHHMRQAIFHENWEMIEHHNRQDLGYNMALNQFADYASDEMGMFTGLLPNPPHLEATHQFPHSDEEVRKLAEGLPENFDLRMEGVISPVKDQAHCGSCWAFSSTAAVEGAVARSNGGRVIDLSEQSLVDCGWGSGCFGCDGGVMEDAFSYILKHGIPTDLEYGSYLEQDGLCHTQNMSTKYTIKGFAKPTALNPHAMKVALHTYGPVAVAIRFNKKMRYYASGIFYDPECNEEHMNHGVVVVGYGVRNGTDFWIVKNSYGAAWGQAGYILISAADNNCFVMSRPIYPIV